MLERLPPSLVNPLGGIPDAAFLTFGKLFRKKSPQSLNQYLKSLNFYESALSQGLEAFLSLPLALDQPPVIKSASSTRGYDQSLHLKSNYRVANRSLSKDFDKTNSQFQLSIRRHHPDKTRPLILCLHGFLMGSTPRTLKMFKVEKLFSKGVDVAFFPWPFHGDRTGHFYQQKLIQPDNLPLSIEGIAQAMHDLKSVILNLRHLGYEKIGLIGASLGGYLGALYSSLQNDFSFLFMTVPALNLYPILRPDSACFTFRPTAEIEQKSKRLIDFMTPEYRLPLLSKDKYMVVYHSGDLVAEAQWTRSWITKWGILNSAAIPGGHWAYLDRKTRAKSWYQWLEQEGFTS